VSSLTRRSRRHIRVKRAAIAWMLVVALGFAGLAPVARGDGDPASDVLLTQQAFFAAQTSGNLPAQRELLSLLSAAQRAHFPIRVAIISSEYDLGSITALWHRPRVYAQFLGIELSDTHNQRLLVVMPNGFGFDWPGHPDATAYKLLAHVSIGSGASGLATAARTAVLRLARADGVRLAPAASKKAAGSGGGGASLWLLAAIALAAIGATGMAVRRRRTPAARDAPSKQPAPAAEHGARSQSPTRKRWVIPGVAALLLVALATPIVLLVGLRNRASAGPDAAKVVTPPPVAWAAGRRSAPGFVLRDQNGEPVSLAKFRGRPVIVTFVDPLCRNLCPLEAHLLNQVVASMPVARRPVILAVSVDVYADSRADLLQDEHRWELVPQWHWAVGTPAQLAAVWRQYQVGVQVVRKQIDSTKINYITHTEAAYIIDATGHERALFIWPFYSQDVERVLRRLT
jgi:cytochrome oxidase Cu insertion factor (SCO1/SenC/PrrC family)